VVSLRVAATDFASNREFLARAQVGTDSGTYSGTLMCQPIAKSLPTPSAPFNALASRLPGSACGTWVTHGQRRFNATTAVLGGSKELLRE
jgi:hypothetical protein